MRALLLFGDTVRSAALRHEIPIGIIDPLLFAEGDGRRYVLTSSLEQARVKRALPDAEVLDYFAFGFKELVDAACELLARAQPAAGGRLQLDGEPLLAEDVRLALRAACAEHGAPCPPEVIVASAWQGYGHEPGSGPLPGGLPIQVDIWPRHEVSACWADMARTFMVGDPAPEHAALIAHQERLVRSALTQAQAAVRPGVTGRELFDAACDLFESSGYPTQRTSQSDEELDGFQYSLGHGVGLEPHEAPLLGLAGHDPLVVGDVLAIEPGLWDRRVGGVTFEDLVLVTDGGCELLTRFPYELTPPG